MHFYPFKIKQMLRGGYRKASQEGWCKILKELKNFFFFFKNKGKIWSCVRGCSNVCYGNRVFWHDLQLQTWK